MKWWQLPSSKRQRRRLKAASHIAAANRESRPRSIIDHEMKKDPEAPLRLTKRWWDWP